MSNLELRDDGRYYCTYPDCPHTAGWTRQTSAKKHLNVHTGSIAGEWSCSRCDYHAGRRSGIHEHKSAHLDALEKVYKCPCKDGFYTTQRYLDFHKKYCPLRPSDSYPENRLEGRVWDTSTLPVTVLSITDEAAKRVVNPFGKGGGSGSPSAALLGGVHQVPVVLNQPSAPVVQSGFSLAPVRSSDENPYSLPSIQALLDSMPPSRNDSSGTQAAASVPSDRGSEGGNPLKKRRFKSLAKLVPALTYRKSQFYL